MLPTDSDPAPFSSVVRVPAQPWVTSTVGAFSPAFSPAAGKKLVEIWVPSNDVTAWSRAEAAGARTASAASASGRDSLRMAGAIYPDERKGSPVTATALPAAS